jgi:hypothetical protein
MKKILKYFPIFFLFAGSVLFSCSGGGCEELQPLPYPVPASQTIENGIQLRITRDGFNTMKTILPELVEGDFGHIAFIPNYWVGTSGHDYGIDFCPIGCGVDISRVDLDFSVVDNTNDSNNIDQCRDGIFSETTCDEIWVDVEAEIYIGFEINVFIAGANITPDCEVDFGFQNDAFEGTIAMGLRTRPEDGYLRLDIDSITDIDIGGLAISLENCIPFVDDILNALVLENIGQYVEMIQAFVGNSIVDFISNNIIIPLLQPTIDKLIPDIGTEGRLNVGTFMSSAGFLGVDSFLEMKMMSGGYVDIKNDGITAGMIIGFNSDNDTDSREETADEYGVKSHSEHAKCVPPMATFDFAQSGLTTVSGVSGASADRLKTFTHKIIQEFNGEMDQAYLRFEDGTPADISIAVTQGMLNLLGFHLVNSGALCLTLGTEQSEIVKVGTFAVLIPSLAEIIDRRIGDAPMQLVIRPQNPIEFIIGQGEGTATPLLDLLLQDFQIDLYPFVNGRYARALTLAMDMHIEMDLEEGLDDDGNVTVMPVLRPVDESRIAVRILNSDLIREDPAEVEAIFPAIVSMIMPMLTSALQPIPMPTYEITKLNSQGQQLVWRVVKLEHLEFIPTTGNDALLINSNLVSKLPGLKKVAPSERMKFSAKVLKATTYSPDRLRATLLGKDDAHPEILIDLFPNNKEMGPFEYQYRLDGSGWYKFQKGNQLSITNLNLFLQGWHNIEVRGRIIGKPQTLALETVSLRVLLDSLAPTIEPYINDNQLEFGGFDYVTNKSNLLYSFKSNDVWSPWESTASIPYSKAKTLAGQGNILSIRVKDQAGNISSADADLSKILPVTIEPKTKSGFGCSTTPNSKSGGFPLFLIMGALFILGRKFNKRFFRNISVSLLLGTLIFTGCADSSNDNNISIDQCQYDADCGGMTCPSNEVALCVGSQCECVDDIPWGIPGPHSSVAIIGQYAWVASYNANYGDLMVSKVLPGTVPVVIRPEDWSFIDGIPDGPVVLPTSDVRGGINAPGDDVGGYTSIAELASNQPIVAHHNYDTGSLRITFTTDGTDWTGYDLDDGGDPMAPDLGNAGLFNDLVIKPSDNTPAVSYMVNNIPGGSALSSEIRFAQAINTSPQSAADWTIQIVDSVEYPYPEVNAPLGDWPEGTGLFLSQDRFDDDRIALAWYDQYAGALKFSYQETVGGEFIEPIIVVGGVEGELPMGLFSSFAIDQDDSNLVHFLYQDGLQRSLRYATMDLTTQEVEESIIDDGFRLEDGTNQNGLPMPVQHFFGADASIKVASYKVFVSWQDATTQELYFATLDRSENDPQWDIQVLRGGEEPYEGSIGFYIDMEIDGTKLYISSYGVNLHAERDIIGNPALYYYVEVFSIGTGIVE